jgi:hypothetical protein
VAETSVHDLEAARARIVFLEGLVDTLVKASVEAWQELGYGPQTCPPYGLAEAIRRLTGRTREQAHG